MKIKSSLEIGKLNSEQKVESVDDKLRDYADKYYGDIQNSKSMMNTVVCILKGRINEKLEERGERAYSVIEKIVATEEYEKTKTFDVELLNFSTAVRIYQIEKGNDRVIFDSIRYIDDFTNVYFRMKFYFYRIQMKFDKSQIRECMDFIEEKKLSVYAVIQMLNDGRIGNKDYVLYTLANLYEERKLLKEALLLANLAIEQPGSSMNSKLLSYREALIKKIV